MRASRSNSKLGPPGRARLAAFATVLTLAGTVLGAAAPNGGARAVAKPPIPVYSEPAANDVSPPLWLIPPAPRSPSDMDMRAPGPLPGRPKPAEATRLGPVVQTGTDEAGDFLGSIANPILSFDGTSNVNHVNAADTTGDVGPHHVVEWINFSIAVYDRAGSVLYGPVSGNTLWAGFNSLCAWGNGGDPFVLYDALADRWVIGQLAFAGNHDFHQCIAVSQTGDPTGPWYRYDYLFDEVKLNDYPKLGVWPDAYYVSVNQFDWATQEWRGQGALAFNRANMLRGGRPGMIYFDLYGVDPKFGGALPADLDGPIPPPAGTPNYFVEVDDDAWGWETDRLSLWEFHVDWTVPSASTFGIAGQPNAVIELSAAEHGFDGVMCNGGACIQQPVGALLDPLSGLLMYRVTYRNFGTHESLVLSHTVDVDGEDHAGVRWYELRDPGGTPVLHQAGTFAPDADHRFMGSAAMNGAGGIALGYSVSSIATYPSIRYAGRRIADPPGTMAQGEGHLIDGTGAQTNGSRWGDYSMLTVDPTDDCTFWYMGQYIPTTGVRPWRTRIGAFKVDGCGQCPMVGTSSLLVSREATAERLTWTPAPNAAAYDVVSGSLDVLIATGGDFAAAATGCAANDFVGTTVVLTETDPTPGDGRWYLVRGVLNGCRGTLAEQYSPQDTARDHQLQIAANACP